MVSQFGHDNIIPRRRQQAVHRIPEMKFSVIEHVIGPVLRPDKIEN
jgi:hypothetical protein